MPNRKQITPLGPEVDFAEGQRKQGLSKKEVMQNVLAYRQNEFRRDLLSDREFYIELKVPELRDNYIRKNKLPAVIANDAVWTDRKRPWYETPWEELTGLPLSDEAAKALYDKHAKQSDPKEILKMDFCSLCFGLIDLTTIENGVVNLLHVLLHIRTLALKEPWERAVGVLTDQITGAPADPESADMIGCQLPPADIPKIGALTEKNHDQALELIFDFLAASFPEQFRFTKKSLKDTIHPFLEGMAHFSVILAELEVGDFEEAKSACIDCINRLKKDQFITDNVIDIFYDMRSVV